MARDLDNSRTEQAELIKSLQKRFALLDAKLSAPGPAVEVIESSDAESFVITFPRKTEQK